MTLDARLYAQLRDIAARVGNACANPDERPSWIHWSDAAVLSMVADHLQAQEVSLNNLNRTISVIAGLKDTTNG